MRFLNPPQTRCSHFVLKQVAKDPRNNLVANIRSGNLEELARNEVDILSSSRYIAVLIMTKRGRPREL
jgi:hypothetical protein